ncbi:MAG: matrixin family metalloprotease [ANME-2 cluster archaeon]|nr:matrixin family metalloprotease [ANME-2 cluster archaeon]
MRNRKMLLSTFFVALLILFSSIPASAYDAPGYKWDANKAYYGWDWYQSIPSSWKDPIRNAESTWDSAGSTFRIKEDFWTANIFKKSLGTGGPQAKTDVEGIGTTITSVKMTFNGDLSWSTTGESNKHDVQDVATHEFGHFLYLGDLYGPHDVIKTMYGFGGLGVTYRRTLNLDDKDGIKFLYGAE